MLLLENRISVSLVDVSFPTPARPFLFYTAFGLIEKTDQDK
jgi:hypothetical protein